MSFSRDIVDLFFPRICFSCDQQLQAEEDSLCLHCRFELPLTNFTNIKNNTLEQAFYGRINLKFATSLLFYHRKGITQRLIHQLKYKGREELGTFFGKWIASELLVCDRRPIFDCIIPVPLHSKRLKERGYNQVAKFAQEIALMLSVPYVNCVLQRKLDTQTQTSKLRIERFNDLKEKFFIADPTVLKNKHVLLVDDVVTTGATIEACVIKLQEIEGVKVSLATIAFTE